MTNFTTPKLFGLKYSNRDFSLKKYWGKNQFNSSFPAALCCYLDFKEIPANYLKIQHKKFTHGQISIISLSLP
ncbi:HindVP family restriction endonuclease [Spirulina subsalsa]|uniref:HindVP family restriction endonuclease n=1 Tax=Spirulina subsalsa TaxID=54311 RepID=UPI0013DF24CC